MLYNLFVKPEQVLTPKPNKGSWKTGNLDHPYSWIWNKTIMRIIETEFTSILNNNIMTKESYHDMKSQYNSNANMSIKLT